MELLDKMPAREIVRQVFTGLAYVHSKTDDVNDKITHRDVKPENILIVRHKRDGSFAIKFTDFDSSKQLDVGERVKITTDAGFTQL